MSTVPHRPIAVVTGASTGIGRELAHLLAKDGYDLFLAADQGPLEEVAAHMRTHGGHVEAIQADLATADGVAQLVAAVGQRPVAVLMANAGHGLGHAFLDQDFQQARHVIDTNITGTLDLIQQIARGMRERGSGRILVTGSIAGLMPGSFQAVYNAREGLRHPCGSRLRENRPASRRAAWLGLQPQPCGVTTLRAGYLANPKGRGFAGAGRRRPSPGLHRLLLLCAAQ